MCNLYPNAFRKLIALNWDENLGKWDRIVF